MENQILKVMADRSSTRGYTEEAVTEEQLKTILEAGLMAPTGMNRQEIHFTVVKGDNPILAELDEEKRRLAGQGKEEHNFYYEAPVLVFLSADESFRWSKVDSGIAVENMTLAAESLGLGTIIIGCVFDAFKGEKKDYFSKKLCFPEGYTYHIALGFGHKKVEKAPHTYDFDKQVTRI